MKALPRLREHLARLDPDPELVLCSSSRRTIDTLEGIRAAAPDAGVRVDPQLYAATARSLLDRLHLVPDDVGGVVLIGHNPGMQDLALLLAGAGDPDVHAQLLAKFPTAAAVTLTFEGSWAQLEAGAATIEDLFTPRRPRT